MASGNPLGIQLYTFRTTPVEERPALLRALAEAGYGAVEPFGDPAAAPKLREELDQAGLRVCSVHANVERYGLEQWIGAARALDTDTLILPMLGWGAWGDAAEVRKLGQVNELGRQAGAEGLRLGYHNHWFEMVEVEGRPALEVFADALDPDILLEVDTYWAVVGGIDVIALLGRLGERVRYLHLKDGPADNADSPMTALGTGKLPVATIVSAARSADWNVVELDDCATDVLTAVRESAAWLREHGLAPASR